MLLCKEARQGLRSTTAGCPAPDVEVVEYGVAEGADACARLLEMPSPPTALLCGNDTLAFGALLEAKRRGLDLPRELSITGFDDLPRLMLSSGPQRQARVPGST